MINKQKIINVNADELQSKSTMTNVKRIVNEQIKIIDNAIIDAHNSGFNTLTYNLPTNFDLNNMDKSDAQILIYSDIINTYATPIVKGGRGLTVHIDVGVNPILYIHWINGMSESDRLNRVNLIRSHTIHK